MTMTMMTTMMTMMQRLVPAVFVWWVLACGVTPFAAAFQASLGVPVRSAAFVKAPTTTTTARHIVLNDDELDAILSTAEDCSEHTQCGVDDVSGLVYELKEVLETLKERSDNVNRMIADLEDMNAQPERKPDEVKSFVKDMLRVFETSDTSLGHYPIGFSGDIGDGPTTAYDSLPPKKWKKPETKK